MKGLYRVSPDRQDREIRVPPTRIAAAAEPPAERDGVRLLVVDPRGSIHDGRARDLGGYLAPGDLVVVNDAATWPASVPAATARGEGVELRLTTGAFAPGEPVWVVALGAGDWRTPTEHRPAPPAIRVGDTLRAAGVALPVTDVSARSPRLIEVTAPADDAGLRALWRAGRPVQYAHVARALAPWDVATTYGGRPWAVEMPSAGRPLSWDVLAQLALRGVRVESLTHAAGLSSTGDPAIDAVLPLPERYEIPARTIDAVTAARAAGHRVVAVGTTVVRALESWARTGARAAVTDLLLDEHHALRAVDAIVSGIHDPRDSHFRLLEAFAPRALLLRAHDHARAALYRGHELGDLLLILPDSRSR